MSKRASNGFAGESRWRVPLADVRVDDELVAVVDEVLRSGWWSTGPRVAEFEREFAQFCRARFALAVANGTAALHLALLAAECGAGDEVVLPSINFAAAANTIVRSGATPVFCDVGSPPDLNLDPADLAAAIGPATKAVIVLHYGGFACDMEAVMDACVGRGVLVIEDAAHAPGSTWQGRPCGTIGHVGCFSFFSNKNLPIGEGGMIVTDDEALFERLRLLRSHGMTTLTWDRERGHASTYDVVVPGLNYRLDEVRAAIGLVQLRRLESENAARRRIAARYRAALTSHGLELAFGDRVGDDSSSHHLAAALLPEGTPREDVRETLATQGVQTSVHYPPIHRFSAYRELGSRRPLPRTEAVAGRILTLPLFGHMADEQIGIVIDAVAAAVPRRSVA
jgi:dTDP-4-amino-4,6-dideoxygalactose transaminase